jgi:plastocyanin
MHIPTLMRRVTLPIGALLLIAACSGGAQAGWTYAPLGPSANPSAAASGAPSGAPSSPSGSGGAGTALNVETTNDQPLVFNPADLTVPAGATVTVTYLNNSTLPHDIHFFNGADNSAPSLGASTQGTGPNNTQTVTFTAPTTPGDYFFWCDVHQTAMKGTWHVQ